MKIGKMSKREVETARKLREATSTINDLRQEADSNSRNYSIAGVFIYSFFAIIVVLGFSLRNMDKKFNYQKRYTSHLLSMEDYRLKIQREVEEEEYTANLCKELARVSGREFAIIDELGKCSDEKVGFQTDNQIIDAIAHYALIKTDKK
jgi:ABC-type Fe3+-citrate transport system substrate-binding protein